MAQPIRKLHPAMVTGQQRRRLIKLGAICTRCHLRIDTHGGSVPCHGADIDISYLLGDQIPWPISSK